MPSNPDKHSTGYLVYVLIILLMVGTLLAWQAASRTEKFESFHHQLAATSVNGAADEIEVLFNELRRSMQLFAFDRQSLFDTILADPGNDALWAELELAVQEHFPEIFGLTLTDSGGNVLRPDFDNLVAEICRLDIQAFIEKGYQEQGVIHPNPLGYHFDIMVPWGDPSVPRGVFFLSFHPDMLSRILQRLQSPGHKLLLLHRNRPGLIEVTASGAREQLQRGYFLDGVEQKNIMTTFPVTDTRWDLADLPAEGLLYREAARNWMYAGIVFSVFVGVTLLMLYQLRRKEKFRAQAEQVALQHQNELAHMDRLNILGEMASGIAHELSQPLSAISTYCQSGLRIIDTLEEKPEKLVHILQESSRQAKRAGEIIHRMQEFATKGKVQPGVIDINQVITIATDFIRPDLDRQDIRLQLSLGHDLPAVHADSIQVEQVILNLFYNAIDSMTAGHAGPRRLVVSSRLAEEEQIEVSVSDTGSGLQPEARERIFDTFFTTRDKGMGLGLAISRSIIEAHGGRLWADAGTGPGATFRFSLPAAALR